MPKNKSTKKGAHKKHKPFKHKKNKSKPQNYRTRLIELLNRTQGKGLSLRQIFKNLKIRNRSARLRLVHDLEILTDKNEITLNQHGYFQGNHISEFFEGTVDFVNPRYAFVICDQLEEDIWIDHDDMNFALDGDRVKVKLLDAPAGKRQEGEIVDIIERKRDEFVGKIEISSSYAFVITDNRKMHLDIFIPNSGTRGAKNGDKVIVKIKQWHDEQNSPVGVVKEILGKAGENETEMHAILAEFDLPLRFPDQVLIESQKIRSRVTKAEINKRRDFRAIPTFTIDPADAKDFDDALSVKKLGNGRWEIGVHIADVTHYVRPNTALDNEAYKRATSVYLVDRVVPMLPEKLSNNLCSLRPNEDRLTFSAVFEMDEEANVITQWFGRTIIHSDRRFAYEEAQEIMDSGKGEMAEALKLLNKLAKKMTQDRFKSGAVNFETTEVRFKLDENGKPKGIYIKERKDAHRLIEEFMLLANKKVAEFIFKMKEGVKEKEKTMIYRVHEKPDMEKLQNFSTFAKKFGYDISLNGKGIANSINRLVSKSSGNPQQDFLQYLAIRTMAKAKYTTDAIGHFGLAFEHYTHFTSPIRRYPDVMVHRLLQRYLDGKRSANREEFETKARHTTDMEKKAADAERASIKYKQVEFMQSVEDKVFEGIVSGVTDWGIYVEIIETKCEGMVRMGDIVDDFYELDADNYRVIGKKTKNIIAFGDLVKVRVKDTNLEKRTLDLVFAH